MWAGGAGEFSKICKKCHKKLAKRHYFSIFLKFKKPCVNFLRVWKKNKNCWEIFNENSTEKLNFFQLRGGGGEDVRLVPPAYATA